jgi:uncharacterized paraquat-inducible protein A
MNPPNAITKHKTCYKCAYETETADVRCPRCGKKLFTKAETRVLGGVLTALGAFLMVVMGAIIIFFVGLMSQSGKSSGAKFNGSKNDALLVFAILGFVLLFGFTSFIAGLWQLIFARRNMVLIWIILGLGAIFLIGGSIFRAVVE